MTFSLKFMMFIASLGISLIIAATPAHQFVFDNAAEPETLDPHRVSAHDASLLVMQMFEGLVVRDSDFQKVEPAIAKSWEVSKDGRVYTFTIRKDLRWSNGEPITLDQVYGSFIRAMDPKVACLNIQNYTDVIEGAAEFVKNYTSPQKTDFIEKLGIKIRGKDKLEFKLIRANPLFLDYLTLHEMMVVHPSMMDPESKAWTAPAQFITNAAYKLKTWEINKQIVFERNPNYRDARKVQIQELVSLPIREESTTYNLYRSKQIDWTGENTISSTLVSSLRADPDFLLRSRLGTYTFVLNIKTKPLDDIRVRRALSLAIHRAEITDKVLRAGQVPTNRYVPPGLEGYRPPIDPPAPFDSQIELAKQLLSDAGFPGGKGFPKLSIAYNTDEAHHKIAQAVQQMWKKYLGVDVDLTNKEWKVFLKEQAERKFDISRLSWMADIPDPTELLSVYMSTGANNRSNWGSKEFDRLLLESTAIREKKKRFVDLERAEKILLDAAPIIPVYHYVSYSLMSSRIGGFKPNAFGKYYFKNLTKK